RIVQAKALQQLGREIELATRPDAETEIGGIRPGLSRLRPRREAVLTHVRRIERRISLLDVGGLPVQFPILEFPERLLSGLRARTVAVRLLELVVQSQPHRMHVEA